MSLKLKLRACKNLVFKQNSFVYKTGWINSIDHLKPVDNSNNPIPWMNYNFISFISNRLTKRMDLFEYGSGYSTNYWSKFVNTVTSIEYDKKWYSKISKYSDKNVRLILNDNIDSDSYASSCIDLNIKFDVIIVDGRNRVDCIKYGVSSLKKDGVIILDDSHRIKYKEAFIWLKTRGFREVTFTGLKPISSNFASTTIFYKSSNCLGI